MAHTDLTETVTAATSAYQPFWRLLNTNGLEGSFDCVIEGDLPKGLRGSLYRNGPGIFERGGMRKRNVLDGDGFLQAFHFEEGKVTCRSKLIATQKLRDEAAADQWLHPTWSTLAPGGPEHNGPYSYRSQAGITVYHHHGKLLAFDERADPSQLDEFTLETLGEVRVAPADKPATTRAHTKLDGKTGDLVVFGNEFGTPEPIVMYVIDRDGQQKSYAAAATPANSFMHDYFATERCGIMLFQPLQLGMDEVLAGQSSIIDSMKWRPEVGGKLMILDKNGSEAPVVIDVDSRFMWHSFNSYERNGEIIADFVGYDDPYHFVGSDPRLRAATEGRAGEAGAPGLARRYIIDVARKAVKEEVVAEGNFEFGMVNQAHSSHHYRFGYASSAAVGEVFHTGLARIDFESGNVDRFDFGDGHMVGEPIFAADPDRTAGPAHEPGWLLALVLSGETMTSSVAVFDAERVASGPVAMVRLPHHSPISFHGTWHAR